MKCKDCSTPMQIVGIENGAMELFTLAKDKLIKVFGEESVKEAFKCKDVIENEFVTVVHYCPHCSEYFGTLRHKKEIQVRK